MVDTILVSAQHRDEVDIESLLAPDLREHVIDLVLAEFGLEHEDKRVLVNPTTVHHRRAEGRHRPHRRKIMVDPHGGWASTVGAARARIRTGGPVGRHMARYVAKNAGCRGAGPAVSDPGLIRHRHRAPRRSFWRRSAPRGDRPGWRTRCSSCSTSGRRPSSRLDLLRPIYRETACYGHSAEGVLVGRPTCFIDLPAPRLTAASRTAAAVDVVVAVPGWSWTAPSRTSFPRASEAPTGTLVSVLFHGRTVKGWVVGPAAEIPRRVLRVRRVLSRVPLFRARTALTGGVGSATSARWRR